MGRRHAGGRLCLVLYSSSFFVFALKLSLANPGTTGDPMFMEFPYFEKEPETEPPAHPFELVRAQGGENDPESGSDWQSAEGGCRQHRALRGHKSLAAGALLLLLFVLLEGMAKTDEVLHDVIVGPLRGTRAEAFISRFIPHHLVADTGALLLSAATSLVLGGLPSRRLPLPGLWLGAAARGSKPLAQQSHAEAQGIMREGS
ncbi:hypothetical protein Esti_005340 [Eimeria stiedai]